MENLIYHISFSEFSIYTAYKIKKFTTFHMLLLSIQQILDGKYKSNYKINSKIYKKIFKAFNNSKNYLCKFNSKKY